MNPHSKSTALILGVSLILGLSILGWQLGSAAIDVKSFERTVKVKGLAEKELAADIVIWPIRFSIADNDLDNLYQTLDGNTRKVVRFLEESGIPDKEISISSPLITDKLAQQYGQNRVQFRYAASQTVTVYSQNISLVRKLQSRMSEL